MNNQPVKKLTFLWCVPRSISTAFEKMMASTQQFVVHGEPFIDVYKQSLLSQEDCTSAKKAFSHLCDEFLAESRERLVFVKDMGYHADPFVSDEFISAINNTFLIRDPRLSIPSLYKMRENFAEDQPGFDGQYRLFERIKKVTGEYPLVMDAEPLKLHSQSFVERYFNYIGVEMPENVLQWQAGSRSEWKDRESWHLDVINSQGFFSRESEVQLDGLPERVLKAIDNAMPHYEAMKKYALSNDD